MFSINTLKKNNSCYIINKDLRLIPNVGRVFYQYPAKWNGYFVSDKSRMMSK